MKTFIYDIVDLETGVVLKENCISTLANEWTAESVELFCGGIVGKAVNVKEINCEELAQTIIDALSEALRNYKHDINSYTGEDRNGIVNWRLGRWASINEIYEKMRGM